MPSIVQVKNIVLIIFIILQGLKHPMIEQDGKFMPNFKFRYLFEDVPYGMAVIKGIASLAGVQTPKLDMVIIRAFS